MLGVLFLYFLKRKQVNVSIKKITILLSKEMYLQSEAKSFFNFRFSIVLGVIIIFILGVAYFFYGLEPSFARESLVKFQIKKGDSFRSVGSELSRESLLRSISVFKGYALLGGYAQKFRPGI